MYCAPKAFIVAGQILSRIVTHLEDQVSRLLELD